MAFAGTSLTTLSDVSGNSNEEAINVVYDLGIVTGNPDGTFQPTKAVTRAEFAALITRALAIPDSALAAYATSSFKDTDGYAWAVPYLAFCNSKGIMLGDGAGNAMPGTTINANEAVTMVLRALGYTSNSAELSGAWPSNYVTKAQELSLYDDVANTTGVDKANAAQIIYNALTLQKVSVNSDGDTAKLWDDDDETAATTMLSAGLNCEAVEGVVGVGISMDDTLINIAKYLGMNGTAYTNDDDEIVAFIAEDCVQLVGRFTDDDTFTTTDSETDYNIDTTTVGATIFDNGETVSSADKTITVGNFGTFDMTGTEYVLNVDLSGKTIKEIYAAVEWTANNSDQVSDSDIADIADDQSFMDEDFILDDNDEIDYTQFVLVGASDLSDIAVDDVVYVYADDEGIRKIEVGTETVTGTVKNFKNVDLDTYATKYAIGANTYKNAEEVINNVSGGDVVTDVEVAEEITAYLDARGYVYDFEDSTSATDFAVVEDLDDGINDEVKLMLVDGTEKVYNYDTDDDAAGELTIGTVIGYGLDSSGEVDDSNKNYITTTSIYLSSAKTIKTISGASALGNSNITSGFPTNATISSDCVVFTIDDDGDYDVSTIAEVETGITITGAVLLFDENKDGSADTDTVVAMIVPIDAAGSGDDSYAVINEATITADDDNERVWNVVGYQDGVKLDALTDDDFDIARTAPDYDTFSLTTAVLYEVTVDADGVVTDMDKVTADMTPVLTAESADDRDSIVAEEDSLRYALSESVIIYRVTDDDEYTLYKGDLEADDQVKLYETDDDNDGYDIVIFVRY
jgi:hypothetical protein